VGCLLNKKYQNKEMEKKACFALFYLQNTCPKQRMQGAMISTCEYCSLKLISSS